MVRQKATKTGAERGKVVVVGLFAETWTRKKIEVIGANGGPTAEGEADVHKFGLHLY